MSVNPVVCLVGQLGLQALLCRVVLVPTGGINFKVSALDSLSCVCSPANQPAVVKAFNTCVTNAPGLGDAFGVICPAVLTSPTCQATINPLGNLLVNTTAALGPKLDQIGAAGTILCGQDQILLNTATVCTGWSLEKVWGIFSPICPGYPSPVTTTTAVLPPPPTTTTTVLTTTAITASTTSTSSNTVPTTTKIPTTTTTAVLTSTVPMTKTATSAVATNPVICLVGQLALQALSCRVTLVPTGGINFKVSALDSLSCICSNANQPLVVKAFNTCVQNAPGLGDAFGVICPAVLSSPTCQATINPLGNLLVNTTAALGPKLDQIGAAGAILCGQDQILLNTATVCTGWSLEKVWGIFSPICPGYPSPVTVTTAAISPFPTTTTPIFPTTAVSTMTTTTATNTTKDVITSPVTTTTNALTTTGVTTTQLSTKSTVTTTVTASQAISGVTGTTSLSQYSYPSTLTSTAIQSTQSDPQTTSEVSSTHQNTSVTPPASTGLVTIDSIAPINNPSSTGKSAQTSVLGSASITLNPITFATTTASANTNAPSIVPVSSSTVLYQVSGASGTQTLATVSTGAAPSKFSTGVYKVQPVATTYDIAPSKSLPGNIYTGSASTGKLSASIGVVFYLML